MPHKAEEDKFWLLISLDLFCAVFTGYISYYSTCAALQVACKFGPSHYNLHIESVLLIKQ